MTSDVSQLTGNQFSEELRQSLPRKISLTSRGAFSISATLAVSVALISLAIGGFIYDAHQRKNASDLAREGALTNADGTSYSTSSHGVYINYTFTCNGESYRGEAKIPEERLAAIQATIQKSGTLSIRYLPDDPSVSHPADWRESGTRPWFLFVPILLAFVLLIAWTREIRNDRRLALHGEIAIGTVMGCKYLRNGHVSLKYEFRDGDDLATVGHGYYPTVQQKGAQISVLYIPEEPALNRPYPLLSFRATK